MIASVRLSGVAPCPQCGARLDAASSLGYDGAMPTEGDLSVCGHCATPLKFIDDAGNLARLTPAELAALPADIRRRLLHAMDVIRQLQHFVRKAKRS